MGHREGGGEIPARWHLQPGLLFWSPQTQAKEVVFKVVEPKLVDRILHPFNNGTQVGGWGPIPSGPPFRALGTISFGGNAFQRLWDTNGHHKRPMCVYVTSGKICHYVIDTSPCIFTANSSSESTKMYRECLHTYINLKLINTLLLKVDLI